jgi:hypothetical protein
VTVHPALQKIRTGHAWLTNTALGLLGFGLVLYTRQFISEADHFTIGFSGCSGWSVTLYLAATVIVLTQPVNRATLWIIGIVAVAMQFITLPADPFLSSDMYRYVWDGIVQHAHINPYRYVPGDPALAFLRKPNQDVYDSINRRDYAHTIYPPVAQMVYYVVTFLSPTVTGMKAAMIGFECMTATVLVALLRRLGRRSTDILLFAWAPVLAWEIAGSGHVDAVVFAFVALALLFRHREQNVLTGLFLGLAVMTKFYPLVLLPALYRRSDWKMPATLAAVCVVGYAIYSSVGWGVFGFLNGYAQEEGINSGSRYFLLDFAHSFHAFASLPTAAFYLFCCFVLGSIAVWSWRYASRPILAGESPVFLRASAWLALAMMLLFSPHYAWYVVWLIPLYTLVPTLPLIVYVCAFFYGFTTALADPGPKMFLLNQYLYGAVFAALLLQLAVGRWLQPRRSE